jgi:hypothetical protein
VHLQQRQQARQSILMGPGCALTWEGRPNTNTKERTAQPNLAQPLKVTQFPHQNSVAGFTVTTL